MLSEAFIERWTDVSRSRSRIVPIQQANGLKHNKFNRSRPEKSTQRNANLSKDIVWLFYAFTKPTVFKMNWLIFMEGIKQQWLEQYR